MAEKVDLKEGVKPVTGAPSSFGRGTAVRQLDDEGRIKTVRTSGAPLDTTNVKTPQEAANPERIGDYYYDSAKNLQVWENSPTDLLQKYRLAVGGTEAPADLLSPSGEALSILGPAVGAGVTGGAIAGGPVGIAVGAVAGLIGGLTNFNNAREEALKRWQKENVKYDSAVEFYKDDDGSVKYKVDYQKMGTGGPRSGERIKEAQNRETQVSLGDDGRLKVKVSPIFASTARFQEMMDFISTNYGNLSKDTENLDQVLTEIKDGIDGEAKSYISNMRLYADFAQKFQNASPETIVSSYTTEMAGYVDPTKMKDFQMTVLGDDDNAATRSAEEFFDSVLSMDKTSRNNLATKLNDIIYGESNNYSDDQRAIAYGELQAMYTASANPEKFENNKYQGMMDADGFVSFMNSFSPLGLNGGDVLKFLSGGAYSKQEMLNPDEWAQFFGGAAGIGAGFGMWKGGTSLIEAAFKRLPGTAQLYAASATGQGMDNVKALFAAGKTGEGIAAWAAEAGFKTLKIGTFDAALAGAQTAVSNKDFWSNFGQDFARDAALEAIFSYYDMVQMQNAVNDSTVRLYVGEKTGQLRRLNEYKGEEFTAYEIGDDGLLTETTYKEGLKANVWQTEKGGTGAVLQTPGGTTVTIVDGEVKYTPGAKVTEGEVVDVTEAFNEIPVMSTGVVNTSEGPIEAATLLEKAGLPKDTQVFEMSESAANAAMVAGKIAKVQGTKFGMEVYKQVFNKNAVLDFANNTALAKDGDLNSWRNAQELFVSVANNAQRNLQDIQNGLYLKDAAIEWNKTIEVMGQFNYQYKYKPKTDGAYINAILNIERAQLLNDTRVEDDTTDYVAKAIETYRDVLTAMPDDRGAALQEWVAQGKKWLKAFNDSVRKSGKVDIEKLDNITETDISESIGWFPVWGKRQKYTGLLDTFRGINKERNPYKSWLRDGEWVPADQLGDPWQNMNRYMAFMTNNMGLNDMNAAAMDVYDRAGLLVDNTPTDATIRKRKLDSVKNKDELSKKFDEMVAEAKKEVEEQALTPAQYSDMMTQIYEESAIPETAEALSKDPENWNEFWNNAPAQTRRDIRSELEKTSLQTGYGISDTRARLNAQIPGADVLDWSLLGREHTNGLVPGGMYAGMDSPVKVYIMSVDDLAKLAGYDLDNAIPGMGKVIEKHINVKDAVPMLPAHIRGSGDGPEIWLKMRWGHNSDGVDNWTDYLKTLKERGVEKVPVAIDDTRVSSVSELGRRGIVEEIDRAIATGDNPNFSVKDIAMALLSPGTDVSTVRRRIRRSIPSQGETGVSHISNEDLNELLDEASKYDLLSDPDYERYRKEALETGISDILGYLPQDITADVQQAFTENGQIPFFHSQGSPLGSIEYNDPDRVPSDIYEGAGDAYWLAPNSSYTDEYGKDKVMGTIPVKYFMSDKEKNELITRLSKEIDTIEQKAVSKFEAKAKKTIPLKEKTVDPGVGATDLIEKYGLFILPVDSSPQGWDYFKRFDYAGNVYDLSTVIKPSGELAPSGQHWIEISPTGEKILVSEDVKKIIGEKFLGEKDTKKLRELRKIIHFGGVNKDRPYIKSYRALAEYAGKPIMDISEDGFASGTAFFYYKGVSPEFDEKIGKQLEIQARGTQVWPEGLAEEMFDEWARKITIGDFLNLIKEEAPESADNVDVLLNKLKDGIHKGDTATGEYNLIHKISKQIEKRHPELSHLAFVLSNRVWTVPKEHNLSTPLAEMGIDRSRFYAPYSAESFLEEVGEENPDYVTPEEKQAWDAIDPTNPANVPTEPQFVQPRRKVTYEDYQKGLQADPEMAGRVRDSYRGAMANRLIKEATRATALAEDYLSPYGYGADWQSYLNTSLIPDLQAAINQNMLPEEFQSFVQARMAQAIQDIAPYQSPEMLLKSRLERVAEEWREWAFKHIKAGRATQKELKEFANTHELNLPNDKRPLPNKIKHALWQMVQDGKKLPEISGLNPTAISKEMDKDLFYQMLDDTPLFQSAVKDKNELLDLISLEKNKETTDGFTMGAAATAAGLGGRYPITKFKNGKPYTRFIKYDTKGHLLIAEQTTKALNDKELLKEDGLISRAAAFVANDFRLLTTGWDPSRSLPNLARDTGRSFTLGRRFINAKETLKSSIDAGSYTPKQREILEKAIENAANAASNSSYNSAYRTTRGSMRNITKDYLSQSGANPMKRFFYNAVHDKRSILEWPMEFFEGYSRRANARSLAAVQLRKDQKAGANFKTQLKNAATAAEWAGREYTANFQRKGELIGRVSKYVAYQSSAYAGFDSMMRAFINDPKLVARNFAAFVLAYLVLLADTLSREETRKQYYRLSDYDRENQIVIGMGDSILTIPMDQELAGLLFPYRRIMETLNGTDPVSFFEFIWGSLTAALPPDLSGFSEGDGFNLSRGLEKLTSQNMPNLLTGIVEASTGYDLYYGTQTSVSKETLKDYGIYAPEPGDYTTTGKDSATLRGVANATGIPQWQLQVMLDNYGGNVGKYVLNTLDKLSGATKDQQGGKDFANTVFNSFTGLDQDAASNAFYAGIAQLKDEKNKLIQKIANYNEDLKTASGDAKVELQNKISQAKRDYGTKVGDFVDKYVSAYEITGGLPKSQAQQVYFLFRLDDDDTLYQSGSVEEYYNNQAVQQFKNQATAMSAPVLDKYYNNRLGNIYQDSEGVWRRYLSSGAQAMRNSIYGLGEQQKVDLLNILEGKDSNMKTLRTQIKNARNQAYEAQDWDTRDALAYELDKQILQAISPYIEQYGAENVLGNTDVLEYLSEWFIVPDDFIRSKKGKYVSLGNSASTQKAFVQPFIKYIFGLPTNFSSYNDAKITPTELGGQ